MAPVSNIFPAARRQPTGGRKRWRTKLCKATLMALDRSCGTATGWIPLGQSVAAPRYPSPVEDRQTSTALLVWLTAAVVEGVWPRHQRRVLPNACQSTNCSKHRHPNPEANTFWFTPSLVKITSIQSNLKTLYLYITQRLLGPCVIGN